MVPCPTLSFTGQRKNRTPERRIFSPALAALLGFVVSLLGSHESLRLEHLALATLATDPLIPRRPCGTASGWHDRRAPGAHEARRLQRS
jgi:hypothetical protein